MSTPHTLIVTTSLKADNETIHRAREQATAWGLPYLARDNRSLELSSQCSALVFSNVGLHIATVQGRLKYHLGTAFIRIMAFERGELDPMLRAGEVVSGDTILDTTLGLGRDARLAARAVGPRGRVVGVESSDALFHLASAGISTHGPDPGAAAIELHHGDSIDYLGDCAKGSFDVVLIDPMFSSPRSSDAGFQVLRSVADESPLSEQWVREARRVASRWVVVKTSSPEPWFEDAGLQWLPSNSNASWYRVHGDP